jgi:hypothetical protein
MAKRKKARKAPLDKEVLHKLKQDIFKPLPACDKYFKRDNGIMKVGSLG